MSGRLPDPLTALRQECANRRRELRAAQARLHELEAHVARLHVENVGLRARLQQLDPLEKRWNWRPEKGTRGD